MLGDEPRERERGGGGGGGLEGGLSQSRSSHLSRVSQNLMIDCLSKCRLF